MKNLDEAIKGVLLERFNPSEVARTLIDRKILEIVPFLNEGDSIKLEERKHISFEKGECFNGFELSASNNKAPVVVLTKQEIMEAFNIPEDAPVDWPIAINSLRFAFYGLPERSKYFKKKCNSISPADILFTTSFGK